MTAVNLPDKDELEILMQERITELEKANQELSAENMALNRDITKHKKAEQALNLTQASVDLASDGILWITADGKVIYANNAACKSLKYSRDELQGMYVWDFDPLYTKEIWPEHWLEIQKRGSFTFETIHCAKDRREFPVEVSVNCVQSGDMEFNFEYIKDITEHKQEEYRISRYNNILKGINRIFSSVVKAETEEELGNSFLSVAIDITGSQIGFIGEVGADGLLHDIAISDMGWEQCLMYDKTGHRRPPGDFILHGLYGSVINSSKGFFTNYPQSHPESIGLPSGHPPLTSFLGVPLVFDGKTIGIIAVANREGGYSWEQQEDLEAIAPAVVQALQKKRDEQERARAEEALIRRENEFRALAENSPDVIARFDRQNRHLYANPAAAEVYGYSQDEIIGKNHSELGRNPEQTKFWERHHQKVFATGQPETMEFRYISPQRREYYFNTRIVPEFINDKVTSVLAISRDITKIKQAEEALRKSEEHYRMLFTNMTEGFALTEIVYDKDGRPYDYHYLEINPAYELNNGVKKEELLGKTLLEVFPNTTTTTIEKFGEVALSGQSINFEIFSKVLNKYIDVYAFSPEKGKLAAIIRDITARKEAEAKLKEVHDNLENLVKERTTELEVAYNSLLDNERRLNEAQKIAHVGNWDNDLVNGKLYWSDEMYCIFGQSPKESINYDKFLSYVHPDDRDYVYNSTKEAFNGKIYPTEYRIVRPDGEEHIVHSEREIIFDEKNSPVQMRGTVQDITEHKKAEEKIRNLANVVESSTEAIITKSFDGIITSWNKGAEQVYGYSAEEVLEKPISILEPPILIGETERLNEMVKQGGKIQQYETLRLRKDGKIINVSLTIYPVFDNRGKITAASVIARDITRRKEAEEKLRESEEKYRNIVETANEGILIIDDEAIVTYANKKIADMLGYSLEESIGRPIWDFADEGDKTIFKQNLEKRRQGISESYELKLICKDGSPLWALINAKSLFDKYSKFAGSLSMLTDITKRKQEERRIRRYNRILEGINRIFSNVVQAKTEEELGNTCLSVALEVTSSQFGFINEIGTDGLLHDIAKSELAWEHCLMYDKTGNRCSPSDFVVHGLYGSVIINEKGFFTNDPSSHPNSAGLPVGHPPLTSFLGVPLTLDGKTIGLIAVANKEGGYSFEQQEDLEAIAPAMMQALQRKRAEKFLAETEVARKQEIHHRIKNNLQVISSLLDLQAENFNNREDIKYLEVLKAFRESQDRVISMALIHEELYKGGEFDTLNFSSYIEELAENLLQTYRLGNTGISLDTDLEENIFFDMDTAVPLGIIVNELISNSLKHAFPNISEGEIRIKLHREENVEHINSINEDFSTVNIFTLTISDNGVGIPEDLDIEELGSLGMQLVTSLVDQLDGELKLKRNNGTEFIIKFAVTEKIVRH